MPKSITQQEAAYDHLDNTGIFDAATARAITGYETDGQNGDFGAKAIAARTGNVALAGLATKGSGLDHDRWVARLGLSLPTSEAKETPSRRMRPAEGVRPASVWHDAHARRPDESELVKI